MKFKQFNEATISPKAKELTQFRKLAIQAQKDFKKGKHKTVINAMKSVAREMTKSIKDLEIAFKPKKGWTTKGYAMADTPKHWLGMEFNTQEAKYDWEAGGQDFKDWLESFINLFGHELVHIEQYRKLLKVKGDINKVKDILFDVKAKSEEQHPEKMDAYLNTHIEIMAHAQKADQDLKHIPAQEVINGLKDTQEMEELADESSDFSSYYYYIRGEYPKTWKKFMKYFIMYLQKRAKKESK